MLFLPLFYFCFFDPPCSFCWSMQSFFFPSSSTEKIFLRSFFMGLVHAILLLLLFLCSSCLLRSEEGIKIFIFSNFSLAQLNLRKKQVSNSTSYKSNCTEWLWPYDYSVVLLLLHDLKRAFTSFTNLLVFLKCNYDLLTSLVYRVIHIYSAHQSHSDLKCSIFYFRIEFAGIQTHYQLSCCG